MNKIIAIVGLIVSAFCLGIVAVLSTIAVLSWQSELKFNDGTKAPVPEVRMVNGEVVASYSDTPSSPRLHRWWNGRVIVTCPKGHHFNTTVVDPINEGDIGGLATCEPNPPAPAN